MKKIFISCFVLLVTSLCVFADHDERFFSALSDCKPYTSNGTVDTSGISADYKSQILGWNGNKCSYKETVNFAGIDTCVTCNFSRDQIDELTKVMRAFTTLQEYSGEEIDTSDLENIKNNPVVKVWNQYIQDPETCTMDISGEFKGLISD